MSKYLTPLLLFVSLLFSAGCQPTDDTIAFKAEQEGVPDPSAYGIPAPQNRDYMPEFELPVLGGGTFDSSDQEGRVLLVNFWATWCGPCRTEIPDLVELQEELGSDQFDVIGISLDMDGEELVREFTDAMEVNYPILLDDGAVAEAFGGVYALPTTFVINKEGKITHRTIGLFPVEAVKGTLEDMINAD